MKSPIAYRISHIACIITLLLGQIFFAPAARAEVCSYELNGENNCSDLPEVSGSVTANDAQEYCTNKSGVGLCDPARSGPTNCQIVAECPNVTKQVQEKTTNLANPIGFKSKEGEAPGKQTGIIDPAAIIGGVIAQTLGVIGALTLAVFLYGGFQWLTSAGNEEKVSSGTKTMLYAVIGLFVIFAAYAMLQLVFTGLAG